MKNINISKLFKVIIIIALCVWIVIIGISVIFFYSTFLCEKKSIKNSHIYFKGCNQIYFYTSNTIGPHYAVVNGADIDTFEQIDDEYYGKDKRTVYYGSTEIKGADPKTFIVLKQLLSRDKDHVYYITETLDLNISEVIFDDELAYLKDTKKVFYRGTEIKGADPKTFKDNVPCVHAIDKNHAYFGATILKDIDPNTIEYLFDNFCRDKNHLIFIPKNPNYKVKIIPQVDPSSFVEIGQSGEQKFYKDASKVYYVDTNFGEFIELQKADSKTFRILKYGFATDDYSLYYRNKLIEMVDSKTFMFIDEHYSKDKNAMYFLDNSGFRIINNADINTFILLDYPYAKDKQSVFYLEKKLERANPELFRKYPNLKKKGGITEVDIYGDGEHFYEYSQRIEKQNLIEK